MNSSPYTVVNTALSDILILEPNVLRDSRGFFFESYNHHSFQLVTKLKVDFVQDNHSKSTKGVLRGLHYQIKHPQGKLVRVIKGSVFDVAVDLRKTSSTFGRWIGIDLSEENKRQLWIPPGYAHGFIVTSDSAELLYKTTDYWYPKYERSLLWCDKALNIKWPIACEPKLGEKDAAGKTLAEAEVFE